MFIDADTCKACGLCAAVCPVQLIKRDDGSGMWLRPDRLQFCMRCGQCMAICPSKSVYVEGLEYERDFFPLPAGSATDMPFLEMIRTRRSIRAFKDEPVPRELLESIVQAITFAPPSFTPLKTEVVIVQDVEMIRRALPEMVRVYDRLVAQMANPIARFFIRRKAGSDTFRTMEGHAVPLMKNRLPELKQGTEDTITRGAPAMIIFSANREAENHATDVSIALTYGFLAAHALGLGATPVDLVAQAVEHSPSLRALFSIPEDRSVDAAMLLGYPRYRYQRGTKRDLKSVTWI